MQIHNYVNYRHNLELLFRCFYDDPHDARGKDFFDQTTEVTAVLKEYVLHASTACYSKNIKSIVSYENESKIQRMHNEFDRIKIGTHSKSVAIDDEKVAEMYFWILDGVEKYKMHIHREIRMRSLMSFDSKNT